MARIKSPTMKAKPRRLSLGRHSPRVTFDDRVQAAAEAARAVGTANGRSTLGVMDESNGAPSWFSYQS